MDITLIGVLALGACYLFLVLSRGRPTNLGVKDGRLARCPPMPNCVSTQAEPEDEQHVIPPIPLTTPADEALGRLKALLGAAPRSTVVTEAPNYLHVEIPVRFLPLVDDVELWIDPAAKLIHFRSASRRGYGDLGSNRRRMERLRTQFAAGKP